MIRYIEYLYLAFAIGLTGFLAFKYADLPTGNRVIFGLAIGLCAFMYSFRRKQRQVLEAVERERIEKLKEQAGEDEH